MEVIYNWNGYINPNVLALSNGSSESNSSAVIFAPPCQFILYGHIKSSTIRIWDVMILIPNVLFLLYLAYKLRYVISKLKKNRSPMFTVAFVLICLANIISVLRCIISMSLESEEEPTVDRVIWLLLKFFLLAVELSVIVFGFMFGNLDSSRSIKRVLFVTFFISLAYSFTQGALEFMMPNDQFHNITGQKYSLYGHGGIMFWFISSLVLFLVYMVVCILPCTALRYRFAIPTRKSFYVYCFSLAVLNGVQSIGCALLFFINRPEGWCIIDVTTYVYFTGFAPLIYLTFLRSFFASAVRPSVHFSYRIHSDDVPDDVDSSLPYQQPYHGPPRETSINSIDDYDEMPYDASSGLQPLIHGWHDSVVGVPELKHTQSRFLAGPGYLSRNLERNLIQV